MMITQLMAINVRTVCSSDSLHVALGLMEQHDLRHIPVSDDGLIVGMLSDRDLLASLDSVFVPGGINQEDGDANSAPATVREAMSSPAIVLPTSATTAEAAATFVESRIGAVPVVSEGELIGLLSRTDLLKYAVAASEDDPASCALHDSVKAHMTTDVHTIGIKDSLHPVVAIMKDKKVRHVPVVSDDRLVGMVSDRDVRRAFGQDALGNEMGQGKGRAAVGATRVAEIMTTGLFTTTPDQSVAEASRKLHRNRISALPVLRDNRLIGIITDTDIMRVFSHQPV